MAKVRDLTTGNPLPLILSFALPLLLGNMLQQMYSVIDAVIVGRYLGVEALAAVGASGSVIFMILGFCNGCGCGFAVPVAQSFGAREFSRMRRQIFHSLVLAAVISLILSAVSSLLCSRILRLLEVPQDIFHEAWVYLLLTFLAIPFTFLYGLLSGLIRALGDSKTPFYFLLFSTSLNVALDLLLVVVFGLGVFGVGLATMIAQALSGFLCLFYMWRSYPIVRFTEPQESKLEGRICRHLLSMGVPMGLQFSITAIGSMVMQGYNNYLGTAYVAAYASAMRVKMVFLIIVESIGIAMASYQGQNYGAGKLDRISSGVRAALKLSLMYVVVAFCVVFFFARPLSELFVSASEVEVLDLSARYLRVIICFFPVLSVLCVLRYSIQGLGYTTLSMCSGVMEMIARILMCVLLVPGLGFTAICYCDPAAWMAADLFLVPGYVYVFRRISRELSRR